jgi:hypothetical protein
MGASMSTSATPQPVRESGTGGSDQPINKLQIEQTLYVALCGGIGGLLSWVLEKWAGVGVFMHAPWYGKIAALVFLGSMAGLFGIYILTSSNLNSMRTYIFAIICGVLWQPIITTAIDSVGEANASQRLAASTSSVSQVQEVAAHGNPEQVSSTVQASVSAITEAIRQLPNVQNAEKKDAIVRSSDNALAALQAASDKAPAPSIEAIKQVGLTANESNRMDVGIHAVNSLREIGLASAKNNRPEVTKAAEDSLQALAASGKDPTVRSVALESLNAIKANQK